MRWFSAKSAGYGCICSLLCAVANDVLVDTAVTALLSSAAVVDTAVSALPAI